MKHLFLVVICSIAVLGHTWAQESWQTVGRIENGQPVLTINKEQAISRYTRNLKDRSNIEARFTDVKIVAYNSESYALVFTGARYSSSFGMRKMGQNNLVANLTTSCTTSECITETMGCVPNYNGGDVAGCRPCSNGGTCTKTVSSTSLF